MADVDVKQSTSVSQDEFMSMFPRFSVSALKALGIANDLGQEYASNRIRIPHLLVGLFLEESGPAQRLQAAASVSDADIEAVLLVKDVRLTLPQRPSGRPESFDRFLPLSSHVSEALAIAQRVAETNRSRRIRTHHLLYGALSVEQCSTIQPLRELGLCQDDVSLHEPTLAGYGSDTADGRDRLGIMREVEALCSVLAAKTVEPPLSLGLFGDWGSGKSFFMQKMKTKIKDLADEARQDPDDSPYCADIVQLDFNAWHYIDTDNLWATLANEVFEGLARVLAEEAAVVSDREQAVQQRAVIAGKIANAESILVDEELKMEATDEALRQSEEKLRVFAGAHDGVETLPGPRKLLSIATRIAVEQPEVSKSIQNLDDSLNRAAGSLGLVTEGQTPIAVKEQLLELPQTWGRVRAFRMALTSAKGRRRNLSIAVIVLTVLVVVWLWTTIDAGSRLQLLASALVVIGGALAPFLVAAERVLGITRSAAAAYREDLERTLKTLTTERDTQLTKATNQKKAVDDQRQEVANLKNQLQALRAEQKVADFIKNTNERGIYRRQLGVIANVHDDFDRLSILLADGRDDPATGDEVAARELLPTIDRIILYIDDLDRCPEHQVVQVLQAVHLLLAFPLFVVVVGVDSRWLLHSLKQHSEVFRSKPVNGDGSPPEEQEHWQSTPLNYLEKIFQIPFALRPMKASGFGALVDHLTTREEKAERRTAASGGKVSEPPPKPGTTGRTFDRDFVEVDPDHLNIENWERDFMKKLSEFIPSPRAAKRFVNIYRLLKASVDVGERATFVGDAREGHYRAAMLLLAIMIGYPTEATEIFRGLRDEQPTTPWWSYLTSSFPDASHEQEQKVGANGKDNAPGHTFQTEGEHWPDLLAKLQTFQRSLSETPVIEGFDDPTCKGFKRWAPDVARYSFQAREIILT